MKHFQYLVAIGLVLMVAITPGFAAKGTSVNKGTIPSVDQMNSDGRRAVGKISDTEIRHRSAFAKSPSQLSPSALAKTSSPVPKVDGSSAITSGMSGTYHIPGDFATITIAVAVANFAGISGATTWQLDSPSYTEASGGLTFGNFATTATLTIQPKAGQATTINFTPSASEGKGFAFNNAHGITIDGLNTGGASLTLQYAGGTFPASDPFAATVYVTGGSSNITVQNTNIQGEIVTSGTFYAQTEGRPAAFVYRATADAASNSNISINHNTVTNATFGFKCLTEGDFSNGPNIAFSYNNVGSAYGAGVSIAALFDWTDQAHYDHNVLDGIEFVPYYWENGPTEYDLVGGTFAPPNDFMFDFGQPTAGHMYQCTNSTMNYNWVKDSHQNYNDPGFAFIIYGLLNRIGGAGTVVANNRITGVHSTDADGTDAGLRTESGAIHNSVRLTGTQSAGEVSYPARLVSGNAYNNAFSNERTGAAGSNIRVLQGTPGGSSDANAFYSANGRISTAATVNAYFATGQDANSQYGPLNFDATMHIVSGPSSAENIGRAHVFTGVDVDGDSRDTTNAGTRDAGADEFANTGSPVGIDILPSSIPNPLPGGVPSGLSVAPQVVVKNNSNQSIAGATVTITITDGYNSGAVAIPTIPPHGSVTATAPAWLPSGSSWTISATVSAAGDVNAGNDNISRVQTVQALALPQSFNWDASDQGWTRTIDFVRSSSFTKLGGPLAGSSMVTNNPLHPEGYTEGAYANSEGYTTTYPGANMLISPWFNLSSLATDVYISFSQSLSVEPGWDGSWIEYTTDGVLWKHLGVANDPNGLNWYNHSVYANSPSWDATSNGPPDVTTMNLYGIAQGTPLPMGWWTSNGFAGPPVSVEQETGVPTGPFGYVFSQLHINASNYPDIVGAPVVKFRFIAFSDAVNPPNQAPAGSDVVLAANLGMTGWAIDNFSVLGTPAVFAGGGISGTISTDVDGSGTINGGDTPASGKVVELKYFGVHVAYDTTDGAGAYGFTVGSPGQYQIYVLNPANVVTDVPVAGFASVNHPATGGADSVRNLAVYQGGITGKKFEDVNDNGVDNSEPGLAGWTIELHRDSCNGALYSSTVSIAGGVYSIPAAPGTWYVKENLLSSAWRSTTGICGGAITVSGPSGGGAANQTGPSFGNFHKSVVKLFLGTDQNGNGVYDGGPDNFPLPFGVREVFDRKHNGVHQGYDTLGSTIDFHQFNDVDTGNYSFTLLGSAPAGWLRTVDFGGTYSVNITTSGQNPTPHFLDFLPVTVSGIKFEDKNGDGIMNGTDAPLSGWKINLSGVGGGSATTDTAGAYSFSGVGGGAHVLSEVVQGGWQATLPPSGSYAINVTSGNLGGNIVRNFGNFKQITISGTKYRDRNGNGSRDFGDNGLSGWTINATNGGGAQVTDVNGDYSFTALGPGTYVLTETPQAGYTLVTPVSGNYSVTAVSGVNVTTRDFGNYQVTDDATYRTWTYNELKGASEAKPVKRPKAGKPILAPPNSANLIADLLTQPKLTATPLMQVGLSGQMVSGKEKGYLLPGKQSDVYATLNAKSVPHTSTARPLAFYNDGIKRLLKRLKSLPASKGNNILLADLLTLRINLAASAKGQTDPGLGLGNLILCEAGHAGLSGKSLMEISYYADSLMTNWDDRGLPGTPSAMWTDLDTVVAKINAAFSTGLTTDTALGWTAPKLTWKLSANTAQSTGFLCAPGPGIVSTSNPVVNPDLHPQIMPTVYALNQNYPNPFNPTTTLSFDLPENSIVTLKVYNMLGQEVATLYNNIAVDAGVEEVEFDASMLTSGVYFYRVTAQAVDDDGLTTGNVFTKTMKMMLVK